jgi:hypothetical protein
VAKALSPAQRALGEAEAALATATRCRARAQERAEAAEAALEAERSECRRRPDVDRWLTEAAAHQHSPPRTPTRPVRVAQSASRPRPPSLSFHAAPRRFCLESGMDGAVQALI